jgi:anaerobic magnesium-protoporphyrin IX monomethyl ester cyclase
MKEIILFYPIATNLFQTVPYSLLYLDRTLRHLNINVIIFDEKHDEDFIDYIRENKGKILLIGMSVMISYQIVNAKKAAVAIKSFSQIPIVFGGWFPTVAPKIVLSEAFVDYVILGQGELPFRQLVEHLMENNYNLSQINGLGFKNENSIIINEDCVWSNIFDYPQVDFAKIDVENYLEHDGTTFQYIATTGCNCNCNFCILSSRKGSRHYANRVDLVINDLIYLLNRFPHITYIKFNDDNFFSNKIFVLEFCKQLQIKEIKLNWCASANIGEFYNKYSNTDIALIKKAGCNLIYMGAESGDNVVLKNINKSYQAQRIIDVLIKMKQEGIKASFSFMVAFPPLPYRDFDITIKFIMKLYRINNNLDVTVKIYLPVMPNNYQIEAFAQGFSMPNTYTEYENMVINGFNMPWITQKLKNTLFYFTDFYLPIFKKELPINSLHETQSIWKFFFTLFAPIVWIRFVFKFYRFNWDAKLGLLIINRINKRVNAKRNVSVLNNFMIGSTRIEK